MENPVPISVRILLWIAQIVLALVAIALIVCMWLPIEGVRDWFTAHGPMR